MIEVSKDAESKIFEGCSIVLEVWTILTEAIRGHLKKIWGRFESIFDQREWGIKWCVNKNVQRLYKNLRGLVRLEAIRDRFRELEAVFESFLDFYDWGLKRCRIKNIWRLFNSSGGLDHFEAIRGRFRGCLIIFEVVSLRILGDYWVSNEVKSKMYKECTITLWGLRFFCL